MKTTKKRDIRDTTKVVTPGHLVLCGECGQTHPAGSAICKKQPTAAIIKLREKNNHSKNSKCLSCGLLHPYGRKCIPVEMHLPPDLKAAAQKTTTVPKQEAVAVAKASVEATKQAHKNLADLTLRALSVLQGHNDIHCSILDRIMSELSGSATQVYALQFLFNQLKKNTSRMLAVKSCLMEDYDAMPSNPDTENKLDLLRHFNENSATHL